MEAISVNISDDFFDRKIKITFILTNELYDATRCSLKECSSDNENNYNYNENEINFSSHALETLHP